ncbi:hypothetical protein B0I63_004047 [Clostridium beijerinckii]|uniref:Uncharacterized protein n=1 Tax=Clostridium beijerinckii TaxID=1520 RepID=A0A9Q5CPN0_CLOBE|nr:hypothetical protein CLBIJ_38480 [Clostridium beijerinckii]MBA2885777.1 hypothetical protein [Clostridium beijerinckii]MBA2900522.1 hypothetical protein [Clostridium beijerinckii]MBA2910336.1 hypothetical protein [Clostridium beijerinckii]MBA9013980.1 hypothetical protein [Clostridium beijerinckii]
MVSSAIVMNFMSNRLDDDKSNNGKLLLGINIFYILFMFIFAITKNFNLMLLAYLATNTCLRSNFRRANYRNRCTRGCWKNNL